jgi:hypothetical protein
MNVIQLRVLKAEERFRNRLATARAILHTFAGSEVSEDLCAAAEHLADDLRSAAQAMRTELSGAC